MASVYVETTVPSYYHETRSNPRVVAWRQTTREWWDRYRAGYSLFISQAVRTELARAPAPKSRRALTLIREIPVLPEPRGLREVVEYYIEHRLMPAEAGAADAYHLAMASLHGMDYLLTWNCRHLANANKAQHITVINRRLGLHVPIITTPLTLVPEEPV
jgi:predicted nucleic acid-binding protein